MVISYLYSLLKDRFRSIRGSLSKGLVFFFSFSLFLFLSSAFFSFLGYYGQRMDQVKALNLEFENNILSGKLIDLEFFQGQLEKEMKELEQIESGIRKILGLKSVRFNHTGDEAQFSIVEHSLHSGIESSELSQLIEKVKMEKEGFEPIYEELIQKKEVFEHTPSIFPVNGYISRGFGMVIDPFTGEESYHQGLDLVGDLGIPVRATAKGRVSFVGWQKGLGKLVRIDHGNGYETLYGHLSVILVQNKEEVKRGRIIGRVGNTGYSTGPHLHYEVHLKNRPVNPQVYLWAGKY